MIKYRIESKVEDYAHLVRRRISINLYFFLGLFIVFFLAACVGPSEMGPDNGIPTASITIDQGSILSVSNGFTGTLTATVLPTNHTNGDVVWTSSNINVLTINTNGNYIAHSNGTAIVTASVGNISANISITVIATATNSLVIDQGSILSVSNGFTGTLTVTVLPTNHTNGDVAWTSGNINILAINTNGNYTAHSNGTAIVTASVGNISASISIIVGNSTNDTDKDGIPDGNEIPGSTFFGMPLYDWGARADVMDIFIHINYMDSEDKGIIPQKAALDKIVTAFSNKNIRIHFDVGDLFDQASGINPSNYDLSDTNHVVPYVTNISNFNFVNGYKNTYLSTDKRQIFYYALFANTQEGNFGGIAEIKGNDMIITLGSIFSTNTPSNLVINFQASVLMHELGHNLNLLHGGHENQNYKPNYFSVMNYLYSFRGLPPAGNPGDRYYHQIDYMTNQIFLSNLSNGPYSDSFKLDYSDGTSISLNEANLNENQGIGRNLGAIDWNTNGMTNDTNVSQNINPDDGDNKNVISDYNDWGNLYFVFYENDAGNQLNISALNKSGFKMLSQEEDENHTWHPPCGLLIDYRDFF